MVARILQPVTEIALNAEERRLEAIERYELREGLDDPALDDVARLAAQVCLAPAAGVAIVGDQEPFLAGGHGFEVKRLATNALPFAATMAAEGVFQVPDAPGEGTGAGRLQVGEGCFRFYAGVRVETPGGVALGCLFVLAPAPRTLTAAQIEGLEALSHLVTTRLELTFRVRENQRGSRARQRVEAALTVEKNFVTAVLDTVGALVVVFDAAGRIVRFNRACEAMSGYGATVIVGEFAWERLIPVEEVLPAIEAFDALREGSFPAAFENYWQTQDGSRRRIAWSATALRDSRGAVAYLIATGLDVTEQRVAETAIRESEARYRQLVEGSLGLVCTHDPEGRILSINEHGARSFGRGTDDVVGRNFVDFVSPSGRSLIEPYFEALRTTGEAQGLMHLLHRDGNERVMAYRNRLVKPLQGDPYVLGIAVDITEQVRAEEQLRALSRQSNSVLESVGDGIYGVDLGGLVTIVNPAALGMLGYRAEEMLGRNAHDLIHHTRPDGTPYPAAECPILGSVRVRTTARVANEVFWRKDGTPVPVEYVAQPQIETAERDGAQGRGRAVGVVVAFTDISERNALERMKDEFISTVSHELRTPLTSLRAALGLLSGSVLSERPDKVNQMMEIAIANTDRLVRLVNDVLDLERIGSGKAEMQFVLCSMRELFANGMAPLQAQAAKKNLRFTVDAADVAVWADPERIVQTLTHLLSNAIKFSAPPPGGAGEVRLRARYLTPGEALIEVEDEGTGIPGDKLGEIFERFKQVDASDTRTMGGTGLGLAICQSIVAQHGGRIWATSRPGEGSTFHFTLPTEAQRRMR